MIGAGAVHAADLAADRTADQLIGEVEALQFVFMSFEMLCFIFTGVFPAPVRKTLRRLFLCDPEGDDHFGQFFGCDVVFADQRRAAERAGALRFAFFEHKLRTAPRAVRVHQAAAFGAFPDLFLLQSPEPFFLCNGFPDLHRTAAVGAVIVLPDDIILCRRAAIGTPDIRNRSCHG